MTYNQSTNNDPGRVLVSIIVPVYNEEQVIGSVIERILDQSVPFSEVIVVDDGSTDGTAVQIQQFSEVKCIRHPHNIGNGGAIKTGIRAAKGLVVVLLDGDGQHDPADIPTLVAECAKYHIVVGARGVESQASFTRTVGNWTFNKFASYVASFQIEDLTSGFRAMRTVDARRFIDMYPNTFSTSTTSTLLFLRSGRTLKYIPINVAKRVGTSKIKVFRDGSKFFLIISKIATLFSPFKVFLPVSSVLFFLGLFWYSYTYLTAGRFTNMSHLLVNSSILIFMLGLVSEQIATLRLEQKEPNMVAENQEVYSIFTSYPNSSSEGEELGC